MEVSQTFPAWYHRGWLRLLREGNGCGTCHLEHCSVPTNCRAGTVLDLCGCCLECGNVEGQICDLDQGSNFYGLCGDNLECRLDVDNIKSGEIPEAQCVCKSQETVCGPDGKTYENICRFKEAYAENEGNSSIKHKGPCKSDTQNFTGNDVIFGCEVSAYPMPHLEWKKKGNKMFLPGDDAHISIQVGHTYKLTKCLSNSQPEGHGPEPEIAVAEEEEGIRELEPRPGLLQLGQLLPLHFSIPHARGGPQRYSVTGWLQIEGIRKTDEGVYVCETKNKYGFAYSSAKLKVIDDASSLQNVPGSWMTKDSTDYGDSFDSAEEEEEAQHASSGNYDK
ncbi:hypothetical protein JD844_023617 [Phrynosoma platyrhinos]|uniref:Kazal-type serine protease inhibitor domain-containing protein 1 n=1 Tax=Phrynosoma platyrhinos TaxID=52577 RepID=A0ABQ7SWU4_PHRPL|nr:hypothetical protein JD844_023617 [Phrynosoma platyrhinos]